MKAELEKRTSNKKKNIRDIYKDMMFSVKFEHNLLREAQDNGLLCVCVCALVLLSALLGPLL